MPALLIPYKGRPKVNHFYTAFAQLLYIHPCSIYTSNYIMTIIY